MRPWLAFAAILGACGGTDSTAADGAAGGPDGPPGPDASPGDASAADGSPGDASTVDATGSGLIGTIIFSQEASNTYPVAYAIFKNEPLDGTPDAVLGACALHLDYGATSGVSADVVTVSGGPSALALRPQGTAPDVTYLSDPLPMPSGYLSALPTLRVTAPGLDFPAFDATVTVPEALANIFLPSTISRSTAANVTWTAGTGDVMWIDVFGWYPGSPTLDLVHCEEPDDGTFTLPGEAIRLLPSADSQGTLYLWRMHQTVTAAGGATVVLYATQGAGQNITVAP